MLVLKKGVVTILQVLAIHKLTGYKVFQTPWTKATSSPPQKKKKTRTCDMKTKRVSSRGTHKYLNSQWRTVNKQKVGEVCVFHGVKAHEIQLFRPGGKG